MGLRPSLIRTLATAAGGPPPGLGGAYLSLFYPGSWNEGISSGQGLMAVALVIFARWNPIACFWAALLFGGAGALGPALQSIGVSEGYYLFYAALRADAWRLDHDLHHPAERWSARPASYP